MSGTLREQVIGAWELVSFAARDAKGGPDRHPLGSTPRGLILYTADGHMSAQLATPDMTEYISYGGRFYIDEETATLHHAVMMSSMPELLARPQFRHASVADNLLTLSASTTDDLGSETASTLVWRRTAVD